MPPLSKVPQVLTQDARDLVTQRIPYWRQVAESGQLGPLFYETSQMLRQLGFDAVLELLARAVEAEADQLTHPMPSAVDWLQAINELHGPDAAKEISDRAWLIADIQPQGGDPCHE